MTQAEAEIITLGLGDLDEFKKDSNFNAPWVDKGIYIVVSPIKNNFFSINATITANLATIRPTTLKLTKYVDGLIILVRRKDRAFNDYELDWISKELFNRLKKTDLDFTCAATTTPIDYHPEKQKELEPIVHEIFAELKDQNYVIEDYYIYDDEKSVGPVNSDQVVNDSFAGLFTTKLSYDKPSGKISVSITDNSKNGHGVLYANTNYEVTDNKE
jgi:hypothetical protein